MTPDHMLRRLEAAFQSDPRVELFKTTFIVTTYSPLELFKY